MEARKLTLRERTELAVAWANGEIRHRDVVEPMGYSDTTGNNTYRVVACAIRDALANEPPLVELVLKEK